MDVTDNQAGGFLLRIPCGLVQDSSIKFIGIPSGLLGKFQIELTGAQLPEEPDPPIILRSHKYPYATNDKYAFVLLGLSHGNITDRTCCEKLLVTMQISFAFKRSRVIILKNGK
jgi:hypothetical protein